MLHLLLACSENNLVEKETPHEGDSAETAPDIVVEPVSVDFGEVDPAATGTATVRISNVGDAMLLLRGLSLVGDAPDLSWTTIPDPAIAPGASVDTVLTWEPVSELALADSLRVESSDPDEQFVDVPLSGTLPAPDILVTPASYDFGTLQVGAVATTSFLVENLGPGPLHVSGTTWAATDADLQVLDYGTLGGGTATMPAGASTTITIQYAPSAAGADEGAFEITSDDPDTPHTGGSVFGNGDDPDPCDGYSQTVSLSLTADDAWRAWIDGTEFTGPNANTWSTDDHFEWEMPCGDHTLAIFATDTAMAVSGVLAVVQVEGVTRFVSGPANWTLTDTEPTPDWTDVGFDDSSWPVPQVCASNSIWGSSWAWYYTEGADWIWWTDRCSDLGQAWLRLNFTVP